MIFKQGVKMVDYIKKAIRTECVGFNNTTVEVQRLTHGIIGLIGEIGELKDGLTKDGVMNDEKHIKDNIVNIREELGDMLWYVAIISDTLSIPIPDPKVIVHTNLEIDMYSINRLDICDLMAMTSYILDTHIKKSLIYGRELDKVKMSEDVSSLIAGICLMVAAYYYDSKYPMEQCMEDNIEKLSKRYPDKFVDVMHRDQINELSHM
jgi:NTP pyrophosphatase (non-canonical NTP hydrolase)